MYRCGYRASFLLTLVYWWGVTPAWAGRFEVADPADEQRVVSEIRASHFLSRATFGASMDDIRELAQQIRDKGYRRAIESWIDRQFRLPPTYQVPVLIDMLHDNGFPDFENQPAENAPGRFRADAWWHNAITAEDQLRQRVAWALAQIFVVNDGNGFNSTRMERTGLPRIAGYSTYYDIFVKHAFGNYRDVMGEVTAHPIMGNFLTHLNNRRKNEARQIFPDENYAREVMQLFTIGLHKVKDLSGEFARDGNGDLIPTYDNEDIKTMARVFTGYTYDNGRNFPGSPALYTAPMRLVQNVHDNRAKILLDGTRLRANRRAADDVSDALDMLFRQTETAPFVSRLLIQRLSHSNPTPEYVRNVARWFHGGRRGARGDMKSVIKAILLSSETTGLRIKRIRDAQYNVIAVEAKSRRDTQTSLREPVVRLTSLIRAFESDPNTQGDRYHLGDTRSFLNQSPYKSPSVFNFYSPDFQPPGEMKEAGLVGPEFQILTAVTVNEMFNIFREACRSRRVAMPQRLRGANVVVRLDMRPLLQVANSADREAFAESLPKLMEHLDLLFCHGTMNEDFKQDLLQIVRSEIRGLRNSRSSREDVVETIMGLVLTSPDCAIID